MKQYILLNIQFTFGENYYNIDPTSAWLNITTTLVGAIVGAFIGFLLYNKREKFLKKRRFEDEKKYFTITLEKALDNTKQQKDKYIDSVNNQEKDLYRYCSPERLCFKSLQLISKLNTNNLIEAFSTNKKLDRNIFHDLFLSIDYIQDILNTTDKSDIDNQRQYFKNIDIIENTLIQVIVSLKQRGTFLKKKKLASTKEFCFIYELIETYNFILKESEKVVSHDLKNIKEVFLKKIRDNWANESLDLSTWAKINKNGEIIIHYIDKIVVNNKASNNMLSDRIKEITEELNFIETVKSNIL